MTSITRIPLLSNLKIAKDFLAFDNFSDKRLALVIDDSVKISTDTIAWKEDSWRSINIHENVKCLKFANRKEQQHILILAASGIKVFLADTLEFVAQLDSSEKCDFLDFNVCSNYKQIFAFSQRSLSIFDLDSLMEICVIYNYGSVLTFDSFQGSLTVFSSDLSLRLYTSGGSLVHEALIYPKVVDLAMVSMKNHEAQLICFSNEKGDLSALAVETFKVIWIKNYGSDRVTQVIRSKDNITVIVGFESGQVRFIEGQSGDSLTEVSNPVLKLNSPIISLSLTSTLSELIALDKLGYCNDQLSYSTRPMDHSSTGKDADSNLKANPLKVEWKGGEIFVDLDIGLDSFVRLAYMTELRSKIAIKLDEVSLQHGCWKGKQKWLIPGKWIQKDIEIYFIVGTSNLEDQVLRFKTSVKAPQSNPKLNDITVALKLRSEKIQSIHLEEDEDVYRISFELNETEEVAKTLVQELGITDTNFCLVREECQNLDSLQQYVKSLKEAKETGRLLYSSQQGEILSELSSIKFIDEDNTISAIKVRLALQHRMWDKYRSIFRKINQISNVEWDNTLYSNKIFQ